MDGARMDGWPPPVVPRSLACAAAAEAGGGGGLAVVSLTLAATHRLLRHRGVHRRDVLRRAAEAEAAELVAGALGALLRLHHRLADDGLRANTADARPGRERPERTETSRGTPHAHGADIGGKSCRTLGRLTNAIFLRTSPTISYEVRAPPLLLLRGADAPPASPASATAPSRASCFSITASGFFSLSIFPASSW